jgi:hypothetical protein
MRRRTTGLIYFLVVVGILVFGTIVVLRTQSERIALRVGDVVTARFAKQRNLSIDIGDLDASLLGDIRLDDVCISYTGEGAPRILLSVRTLSGRLNLASLVTGKIRFDSVTVVSPTLVIPKRADGTWIYPSGDSPPGAGGEPASFEVMNIGVTDASVRWESEEPRIINDLDVVCSYEQDKRSSMIKIRQGSFVYGEAGVVDGIAGMVRNLEERVEVRGTRIKTPHSRLGLSGSFGRGGNDSLQFEARVDSLDLGEIPLFTGSPARKDIGIVGGGIRAHGTYSHLNVETDLSGDVSGLEFEDLIAGILYEEDAVSIDHLTTSLNGTPVSLSGKYSMTDPPAYEGIVAFSNLDLADFIPGGEEAVDHASDLSGSVRFRGRGLDSSRFALTTWPELDRGRYRDYVFDSVGGVVGIDWSSVSLDSVVARVGGTRLETRGRIGYDGGVGLSFLLDCPDLEDIRRYHGVDSLRGEVAGRGSLTVEEGALDFMTSSVAKHLDYSGTLAESLVVTVTLGEAEGRLTGRGEVFASGLDIHGLKASEFIGNVAIDDRTVTLERAVLTRDDGSLVGVTGDLRLVEGGFDAGIVNLFVGLGGFIWENEDTVFVTYRPDSLSIADAEFSSEMGRISLPRFSYVAGTYSAETRVADFDLGLLGSVLKKEVPTGILDMTLEGSGRTDSLLLSLDFTVKGGEIRSVPFEALTGSVEYDGRFLRLGRIALVQNGGSVGVEGEIPVDLAPSRLGELISAGRGYDIVGDLGRIAIEAEGIDISLLEPLVPPVAKIGGLAELTMEISGNKANPRVVSRGRLREASYGADRIGDVTWNLALQDSVLKLIDLTFGAGREKGEVSGEVPIAIAVLPFSSRLLERPLDVRVVVEKGDLGLMCEVVPGLKVCSGTYETDLRISGDAKAPEYHGYVKLSEARLRFEGVAQDVRGISLELEAEGRRFTLKRMTAEDKALKATGFFTLDGMTVSDWHFDLEFKDFSVTEFEDVYARFDGQVTIRAEELEAGKPIPAIEGHIKIKEGEYFYSLTGGGGEAGEGTILGPSASPSWVMDLEVEIPNAFWIRGGDIEAELQGDLTVSRGREGLLVLGSLRTLRGKFYVSQNAFRITRGDFRFEDVTSLRNVYIDLEANSRVLDEKIELTARGTIDNLDISATSESGWSETQILAALTVGRGSGTEEGESRFFSNEFLKSWALALVNRYGVDAVAREVNLDLIEVDVDLSKADALAATRVTFGKYVSDKVYLEFSQALGSLYEDRRKFTQMGLSYPERQLSVEYRLSDRFSIEGETGTIGGLGYFDVDLRFKYGY